MFDRRAIDDITDMGFIRIHCHVCGYHGWSDDSGNCPYADRHPEPCEGKEDDDG